MLFPYCFFWVEMTGMMGLDGGMAHPSGQAWGLRLQMMRKNSKLPVGRNVKRLQKRPDADEKRPKNRHSCVARGRPHLPYGPVGHS
jgi:hypothetical protein